MSSGALLETADGGSVARFAFHDQLIALIRSLGLHLSDQTPCGQPVAVGEAHAMLELTHDSPMSQSALTSRLRLEKSTVSRLAASLERRGWLRRTHDTNDGRVALLSLTASGRNAAAKLAESRRQLFDRLFEGIPRAKRDLVADAVAVLTKVIYENR